MASINIFKLLTGRHTGAEITLENGVYLIGSGPDCDIVLSDDGVEAKHLRLYVEDDIFRFEPISRPVFIDGQATQADAITVAPLQVLTIGTAALAIGPRDADFDKIPIPIIDLTPDSDDLKDRTEQPESSDNASGDALPEAADKTRTEGSSQPEQNVSDPLEEPAPGQKSLQSGLKNWWHGYEYLAAVVLAVIAVSALMIPFYQYAYGQSTGNNHVSKVNIEKVQGLISSLGHHYRFIRVEKNRTHGEHRKFEIIGYLPDYRHNQTLMQHLQAADMAGLVYVNVIIGTVVEALIDSEMKTVGFSVDVQDLSGGIFAIDGVVDDPVAFDRFLRQMRIDIPQIRDIKEHIVSTSHLIEQLKHNIVQQHIRGDLHIKGANALITATGFLDSNNFTRWQKIIDDFNLLYSNVATIDNQVDNVPGLDLSLRSVVHGPRSFIILANLGYFSEGMTLPNGFRLEKITQGHLLISRDGQEYRYVYGEHDNG